VVDAEIIKVIKKYLDVLAKNGVAIEQAFLYGSYARNEARKNSDIDVMLVSSYFDTNDVYRISKPWRFAAETDYRIEPVSVSTKRFMSDDSSPLIAIVKKEGIEIKA
jgi:predicted nucleotidyltransferase